MRECKLQKLLSNRNASEVDEKGIAVMESHEELKFGPTA
jgi:hypothetical protein